MPVNHISDADIHAISIVGKGANRKRFFLFKSGEEPQGIAPLGHGRLLKAKDWSTVYCVVAEPGWHENSGIGGPDIDDVWASEEEIRKAAHRFMANGGLVNKMHESLEPYGDLVENAVALADFTVDGATIKKGSWYIAITPNADGKEAIDKGEFTGVSIEGFAHRELVEKGSTPDLSKIGRVEKNLLKRVAEKVGLTAEEIDSLEKSDRTFGEIISQREFDKALPDAFDAFRDAVWGAFFPCDSETADPVALITESCDEFKAWCLDQLESVPVEKSERAEALGVTLEGSTPRNPTLNSEDHMSLTEQETARIEKLETAVEKISTGVEKLIEKAEAEKEPEAPTVEGVSEQVGEVAKSLEKVQADIAKLGEGGSSQTEIEEEEAEKADPEAVKKAYTDRGLDPNLRGIL